MPQMNPVHFVSEVLVGTLILALLIYIFSKWILPAYLTIYKVRKVTLEGNKKIRKILKFIRKLIN